MSAIVSDELYSDLVKDNPSRSNFDRVSVFQAKADQPMTPAGTVISIKVAPQKYEGNTVNDYSRALLEFPVRIEQLIEGQLPIVGNNTIKPMSAVEGYAAPPCGNIAWITKVEGTIEGPKGGSVALKQASTGEQDHSLSLASLWRRMLFSTREQFEAVRGLFGHSPEVPVEDELNAYCNGRITSVDLTYDATAAQIERNCFISLDNDIRVPSEAKKFYGPRGANRGLLSRLLLSNIPQSVAYAEMADGYHQALFPTSAANGLNHATLSFDSMTGTTALAATTADAVGRYKNVAHFKVRVAFVDLCDEYRALGQSKCGVTMNLTVASGELTVGHSGEGPGAAPTATSASHVPFKLTDRCTSSYGDTTVVANSVAAFTEAVGRAALGESVNSHRFPGGKGRQLGQRSCIYSAGVALTGGAGKKGGASVANQLIQVNDLDDFSFAIQAVTAGLSLSSVTANDNDFSDRLVAVRWGPSDFAGSASNNNNYALAYVPQYTYASNIDTNVARTIRSMSVDYSYLSNVAIGENFNIESPASRANWKMAIAMVHRNSRASGLTPANNVWSHTPYYPDVHYGVGSVRASIEGNGLTGDIQSNMSQEKIFGEYLKSLSLAFGHSGMWNAKCQALCPIGFADASNVIAPVAGKMSINAKLLCGLPVNPLNPAARVSAMWFYERTMYERGGVISDAYLSEVPATVGMTPASRAN